MRRHTLLVFSLALALAACGSATPAGSDGGSGTSDGGAGTTSSCHACVSSTDCQNEQCIHLSPTNACGAACLSDSNCGSGERCVLTTTAEGKKISACLASSTSCSGQTSMEQPDAGPMMSVDAGTGSTRPPALVEPLMVGGPVTAHIDAHTGGTMDRLLFAVVGDTRASTENDVNTYPTTIINGVYSKLAAASPQPAFAIGTGDYAYASPNSGTAEPQYKLYMSARAAFQGPFWPAMGNHECNGSTTSNCFPGDGSSENIDTWIHDFLTPIGETKPYFVRNVNAINGSWTAKFIFLAPNSWNTAQASFLQTQLARKTTYTFVIRHEPSARETAGSVDTANAPGTMAIDSALANASVTAVIEGHSHTWYFDDYTDTSFTTQVYPKEIIVGNGGAPMSSTKNPYGFTVISQRLADNAIVIGNYDYSTGLRSGYYYAITPDGKEIQYAH